MKLFTSILIIAIISSQTLFGQNPPTVDDPPTILGSAYIYQGGNVNQDESTALTASYVYNGDNAEGTSQINWYRVGDATSLGTDTRYQITRDDISEEIYFTIRPADDLANLGTTYTSAAITVIKTTTIRDIQMVDDTDDSGGTEKYLNLEIKGNTYYTVDNGTTVHIYGDLTKENGVVNKVTFNIWDSSTVILHGQFIAQDEMEINVSPNSTFTIVSGIDARHDAVLDISGSLVVNGDVSVEDDATFTIADGGSLDVDGDVSLGASGDVTIEGTMTIGGDLDTGSGVDPNNTIITVVDPGTIDITGDIDGTAEIAGDGTIYVAGNVGVDILDTSGAGDSGTQINNTPLPIELITFNTFIKNDEVVINWQTGTEENNDYFTIERSPNGIDFEEIAYVTGAGNSGVSLDYSYTDVFPLNGVSYYRLKQTDYNGDNETFDMVAVNISTAEINNERLNFRVQDYSISIDLPYTMNLVNAEIFEISGRLISTQEFNTVDQLQIKTNDIPMGIYIIRLSDNSGFNYSEKMQIK